MALAWQPLDLRDDTDDALYAGDPAGLIDAADLVAALATRPAWMADASCREHPDVTWFPKRGQSTDPAKAICTRCLVRAECEQYAYEAGSWLAGIWGGSSERVRRHLRRTAA